MKPRISPTELIKRIQRASGTGRGRWEVWQPFGYFIINPCSAGHILLRELWVVPELRGQGHARRSVQYLQEWCHQYRFNIYLVVRPFDSSRASRSTRAGKRKLRAFYQSCGFVDDPGVKDAMLWSWRYRA